MPQIAVAIQHRDEILDAIATGAHLADIAAKFGIQAPAISKHLASDPDYKAARELALETRLEQREKELESAPGIMAEISRAATLVRHAQWRCEREAPGRWGAKTEVTHIDGGNLSDRLRRSRERVIEAEPGDAQIDQSSIAAPPPSNT